MKSIYANPDSAATSNYSNEWPGVDLQHEPIVAACANEYKVLSTKRKESTIEELPKEAK